MKISKFNVFIQNNTDEFILLNSLTGETFTVDQQTKVYLEEEELEKLSEDQYNEFKLHGILIEDDIDENRYFSYFRDKQRFNNTVVSATVLLTWSCNLNCIYCFQGEHNNVNHMTYKDADKFVKFMINQTIERKATAISINLFGGEPLLNFEVGEYILDKLSTYCKENNLNFYTSIITNGILLTDDIITILKKYSCLYIQITLDGIKKIHDERRIYKDGRGSFDKTIESIKLLVSREDYINPLIRINIDKNNIEDTYEVLEYLSSQSLNCCNLDFGIVHSETNACSSYSSHCLHEDELSNVLDSLWDKATKLGFTRKIVNKQNFLYCGLFNDASFTVDPSCNVYKCWELVGDSDHKIGEINDDGYFTNVTYRFYDWMTRDPLKISECASCSYLPACGGGCGVVSFRKTGSYHGDGCFKSRAMIQSNIKEFINKKQKEAVTVSNK